MAYRVRQLRISYRSTGMSGACRFRRLLRHIAAALGGIMAIARRARARGSADIWRTASPSRRDMCWILYAALALTSTTRCNARGAHHLFYRTRVLRHCKHRCCGTRQPRKRSAIGNVRGISYGAASALLRRVSISSRCWRASIRATNNAPVAAAAGSMTVTYNAPSTATVRERCAERHAANAYRGKIFGNAGVI